MRWHRIFIPLALIVALVPVPPARAKTSFKRELARSHYETGSRYYQMSDYKRALAEFQQAYRLEPLPGLAFNIARCHEMVGDMPSAIEMYETYLHKKPDADNRDLVMARLETLRKKLASKKTATEKKARPAPAAAPSAAPPEPAGPPAWIATAGWVGVGLGAAAMVTGAVFGGLVASRNSAYMDGLETLTHDELNHIADQGEAYEKAQLGLVIGGGVLAAAGAGLLLWHLLSDKEHAVSAAGLAPHRGGLSVSLTGRF